MAHSKRGITLVNLDVVRASGAQFGIHVDGH